MKKLKKEDYFVYFIGAIFLLWGISALINSAIKGEPDRMFWICYIALIISGIGCFMKKGTIIASQLNILLIYLTFWNIDFLSLIIQGKSLFGISDYFFGRNDFLSTIVSYEHLFIIPFSLIAILILGIKEKDFWKASIIQAVLMISMILLITNPTNNINCMFSPCTPAIKLFPYYPIVWIGFIFGSIFISSFLINKFADYFKD